MPSETQLRMSRPVTRVPSFVAALKRYHLRGSIRVPQETPLLYSAATILQHAIGRGREMKHYGLVRMPGDFEGRCGDRSHDAVVGAWSKCGRLKVKNGASRAVTEI